MSPAQETFYHALAAELSAARSGIGRDAARLGTFGLGQRFMDIIKKIFSSIDVSSLTKDEFLAAVSMAFDNFIAPMLASSPMGLVLTPLVKALVMGLASQHFCGFFQQLTQIKVMK